MFVLRYHLYYYLYSMFVLYYHYMYLYYVFVLYFTVGLVFHICTMVSLRCPLSPYHLYFGYILHLRCPLSPYHITVSFFTLSPTTGLQSVSADLRPGFCVLRLPISGPSSPVRKLSGSFTCGLLRARQHRFTGSAVLSVLSVLLSEHC